MAKRFFSAFLITTLITCGYFYYLKSNGEAQVAAAKQANAIETAAGDSASGSDITSNVPFELTDQNGKKVTDKDFAGKKLLVYFGFTHCPDVCPVTMAVLTETMNQLDTEKIGNIQPVFISIDPQNDTPAELKKFLKDYHPSFIGLTGSEAEIDKVKKAFRVYAETPAKPADEHGAETDNADLPGHSNLIYFMDTNGKYLTHFTTDNAPEDIVDYISAH